MSADHLGVLLSAYLDGALRQDELPRVAGHLEVCSECIVEFRAIQQGRSALRMLPWLALPESLEGHPGDLLSAFLDGECTAPEAAGLQSHLGVCAVCRDELHELDAARTAIRSLPTLEFTPIEGAAVQRHRRHRAVAVAGWAAGIAAAAAISLGVVTADRSTEQVDLDSIASRHSARMSVETGLPVVPVMFPTESSP